MGVSLVRKFGEDIPACALELKRSLYNRPFVGVNKKGGGVIPLWEGSHAAILMTTRSIQHVPILMYHSISDQASSPFRQFAVPPSLFAEQMAYLHDHWYTPITVSQFIQARSQPSPGLPARPVVITFDDGFADFFSQALPVLQRYDFSATLYITTAFVNRTSHWLQHQGEANRPLLTWDQLREVCACGIECGAHSHSHPQLDTLSDSQAQQEIALSKSILEDALGQEILSFAYPFGYQTARTRHFVQQAGYTSACVVKHRLCSLQSDAFALERILVADDAHSDAFAALLIDRSPSLAAGLHTFYLRARTPVWQFIRLSSLSFKSHFTIA